MEKQTLVIQLTFTQPLGVSTSPYDQDKLAIGIKDPSVFTVKDEGRPMKFKSKNQLLVLVAQIGDAASQ